MKINLLTTVILLTPTLFVTSFCHAQERSADSNPSQNLDHPAQYADPSIVPFEGEALSDLSSGSRQIQRKQQRVVGSIVQLPSGELKFLLRPGIAVGMGPLNDNSRGEGRVAEAESSDKLPSSESGAYSKPEGFGSDEMESVAEEGAKNESDLSGVSSPDELSRAELLKIDVEEPAQFGHAFQMPEEIVYTTEDTKKKTEKETTPELAAGSRAPVAKAQYKWRGYAGKQGSYKISAAEKLSATPIKHKIRLINIEFNGQSSQKLWKKAFFDAARFYEKEGISYPAGADNKFFKVRGLSNSKKRIVGYYDYTENRYAYVVITRIDGGKVYYTDFRGKSSSIRDNPGNFVEFLIGKSPGVFSLNGSWHYRHTFAIQIWKHGGAGNPDAAVSLRLYKERISK